MNIEIDKINYTMKNDKAPASFLICSAEVAEQLKKVFNSANI